MNLNIDQLVKTYNNQVILDHLSIDIKNVKTLALIGASGSGKSTLLRLMAGLESYDSGSILINGQDLSHTDLEAYRKSVGFVFQDHNLFNHLSVLENICIILEKVHKRSRSEILPTVLALLEKFGLTEHQSKKPHQISGGQSQRVSIVRALAIEPALMFLDEPTSSLDPVLTYEVLEAIQKLVSEERDFIIVTHEIGFARRVADYVIYMEDGHIIEHGGPEIFNAPQTASFQNFLAKVLNFSDS